MTITLGWWMVPLLITIVALAWVMIWGEQPAASHGYARAGAAAVASLQFAAAVIASLVAWLVYAAAT